MSRHGARIQRQQATERAAARRLLGALLEQARAEGAGASAVDESRAWHETPGLPVVPGPADATLRDLYRWAILVALVCGGLLACGVLARC